MVMSGSGADVGLSEPTDADLVALVVGDDDASLEELHRRYQQPVFSMCYGILRSYELAEDVTQEVFLALWRRAASFDPSRGVFRHWFLHLAHNRIIDELRRRRRTSMHAADQEPDDPALGLVAPGNTADEAITAVLFGDVKEALMTLPEEQRSALVMAYLQGNTQQEIADKTQVPLGTVKTRLRLGLIKLRAALGQPMGEGA